MPQQISEKAMNGWGKRKQDVAIALAMNGKENRGNRRGPLFLHKKGLTICIMIQLRVRQKQKR
jgi:hypothetical protein